MKLSKYTIGAVAGIATLAVALPFVSQFTNAAGTGTPFTHPILTQVQVQAMVTKDQAFLTNIDAFVTIQKNAVQAHETALTAAAAIADDTQRDAAVKKANTDERAAIQAALTATPAIQSAMMRFGGDRGFGEGKGGPGMMGLGPNTAALATKLGMTEEDLKAALASGQTIQQIATAHGVTLPADNGKGEGKRGKGWMMGGLKKASSTSSTSSNR
ncbi:MAG: hypothetical protein WCG83_04760 [Candidatus Peregrinibacteria bacterium]